MHKQCQAELSNSTYTIVTPPSIIDWPVAAWWGVLPYMALRDYLRLIYLPRRITNLSYFCLFLPLFL